MNASPVEHEFVSPTPEEALLDVRITPDGTVVVAGEVDFTSRDVLARVIHDVPENAAVCLDMRDVSFVDSSGLALLISTFKARDGAVRVVHPSHVVERLLRLTWQYDRFVKEDA